MPFARFARMPAEKRERLLTVAAREFGMHGYEAASLNRILDEAGIGKSSAYYYFEDKADLFGAVVEYSVERLGLAASAEDIQTLTAESQVLVCEISDGSRSGRAATRTTRRATAL